jgi:hypothetical protein
LGRRAQEANNTRLKARTQAIMLGMAKLKILKATKGVVGSISGGSGCIGDFLPVRNNIASSIEQIRLRDLKKF